MVGIDTCLADLQDGRPLAPGSSPELALGRPQGFFLQLLDLAELGLRETGARKLLGLLQLAKDLSCFGWMTILLVKRDLPFRAQDDRLGELQVARLVVKGDVEIIPRSAVLLAVREPGVARANQALHLAPLDGLLDGLELVFAVVGNDHHSPFGGSGELGVVQRTVPVAVVLGLILEDHVDDQRYVSFEAGFLGSAEVAQEGCEYGVLASPTLASGLFRGDLWAL